MSGRSELFKVLPPEARNSLIQSQLKLYTDAVAKHTSVTPLIATISAAFIAVFAVNPSIISLQPVEAKILFSFLSILVPVSLFAYVWEQRRAANNALEIIGDYQGKNISAQFKEENPEKNTPFHQMWAMKEEVLIVLIFLIIVYVVLRMWQIISV